MLRVSVVVIVVVAGLCSSAQARTVTYANVVSPSKQISCLAVKSGSGIECGATYLPSIGDLDPYLGLRAHGKTISGERGDYPGYNARRHTLRYGDTWKRPGISCSMKSSGLTCRNLDQHGFRLAKGRVRRF